MGRMGSLYKERKLDFNDDGGKRRDNVDGNSMLSMLFTSKY